MIQAPDIGKVIFEHTSDSHVVELPFGLGEWHLPTGWHLFGVDVSPTKHVVFMVVAAVLVFLTVWYAGRQVERLGGAHGVRPAGPRPGRHDREAHLLPHVEDHRRRRRVGAEPDPNARLEQLRKRRDAAA